MTWHWASLFALLWSPNNSEILGLTEENRQTEREMEGKMEVKQGDD